MKPKTLMALVLIIACGAGFIWYRAGLNKGPELDQTVHITRIQAAEAQEVKKENALSLTGTVKADREAAVSSKVPGKVMGLSVQNGDPVSAGQVLIRLDDSMYRNVLTAEQASLSKAQANLASVRLNLGRIKSLFDAGAASQKDLDDITVALSVAEADVSAAQAAVSIAEENVSSTRITAPISGLASNRLAELGQMVAAGTPLLTVEDSSSVRLVVNVEQKDLSTVVPGLQAQIKLEGFPDNAFTGTVERINPSGKASARTFETDIRIPNGELHLKPGMFAEAVIRLGEPVDVLAIPLDALAGSQGEYHVFIIEGDRVKRQTVEIGATMGRMVEIRRGLTEGQKIAGTNVNKLKDQDRILVVQ